MIVKAVNTAKDSSESDIEDEIKVKNANNCTLNSYPILSGLSHELRTHMNAIMGFSILLREKGYTESEREELSDQVLNSCEQLTGLFDSFFNLAVIDSGYLTSDISKCNPDDIIGDLIFEFSDMLKKAGSKDIVLEIKPPSQNTTEVFIDAGKISGIIRCLFQNAVKNTRSGYIKIGYLCSNENITFYVSDSGQGYFKNREFLYTRSMKESMRKYNDTSSAINLSLAKKTTQMLGGSLWIECTGISGTEIFVSFPIRVTENPIIPTNRHSVLNKKHITL
jgi:K+-sensing histidine kinase KdpD